MNFKRLQTADRWIAGIALLCLVASLCLIVDDRWLLGLHSDDTKGLTAMGTITSVEEDVRRRSKVAFSWLPLQSSDVIFQDDSIFTGPESGATIKTFQGDEIYVAPNSLVVISRHHDSLLLKIDYGSIKGKVERGKKLFISSSEGVTEFSGHKAVVDVKVKKNKPLAVKVLKGEVTMTSKNHSSDVKSDASLEVLLPNLQTVEDSANSKPETTDDQEDNQEDNQKTIEVAAKPRLAPVVKKIKKRAKENVLKLPLVETSPPPLEINNTQKTKELVTLYPQPGQSVVFVGKGSDQLQFRWSKPLQSLSYRLQASSSPNFSDLLIDKTTTHNWLNVKEELTSGDIYWRVRAENSSAETTWTEASHFQLIFQKHGFDLNSPSAFPAPTEPPPRKPAAFSPVSRQVNQAGRKSRLTTEPLQPPELDTTTSSFVVDFDKSKISKSWRLSQQSIGTHLAILKAYPLFKWRPKTSQKTYFQFEVATDPQFRQKLFSKTLHVQHYQWRTFQPGVYYWRVAAKNSKGESSDFSSAQKLSVVMEPPKDLTSQSTSKDQRRPASNDDEIFELSWDPLPFARVYEVHLGKDADFKESKIITSAHPQQKIQVGSNATYYWKVRALSAEGKSLTAFSAVQSFGGSR